MHTHTHMSVSYGWFILDIHKIQQDYRRKRFNKDMTDTRKTQRRADLMSCHRSRDSPPPSPRPVLLRIRDAFYTLYLSSHLPTQCVCLFFMERNNNNKQRRLAQLHLGSSSTAIASTPRRPRRSSTTDRRSAVSVPMSRSVSYDSIPCHITSKIVSYFV